MRAVCDASVPTYVAAIDTFDLDSAMVHATVFMDYFSGYVYSLRMKREMRRSCVHCML